MPQRLELVATNLDFPVSFVIAPDGRILFNELQTGRIRALVDGQLLPEPVARVPIVTGGERGLLGLALHPQFPACPWIYVYHTTRQGLFVINRVTRLRITGGGAPEAIPVLSLPAGFMHNGGILGLTGEHLFITTGDTGRPALAQDPGSLAGKILRLWPDGQVPADNPLPGSPVFTLGHRNVFGLAFHPLTGVPYITENGPDRDDEVNRLIPGGNYGWPRALGRAGVPGFVDPLVTFTPVISPTGAAFYTGTRYGFGSRNALFFGDWGTGAIRRLVLFPPDFATVTRSDVVVQVEPQGILAVVNGPDGFLYFSTPTGIWRVLALA